MERCHWHRSLRPCPLDPLIRFIQEVFEPHTTCAYSWFIMEMRWDTVYQENAEVLDVVCCILEVPVDGATRVRYFRPCGRDVALDAFQWVLALTHPLTHTSCASDNVHNVF